MAKQKDARKYTKFGDVYEFGYAAIAKLDERSEETDDPNLRQKLAGKASEIRDKLREVRRAQRVILTTPDGEDQTAVSLLNSAIAEARKDLAALEHLSKALAAANRLLSLATRLISIVA